MVVKKVTVYFEEVVFGGVGIQYRTVGLHGYE